MQIQIGWLLQKPTDLDLHCLQKQGISGFSRTRVKLIAFEMNWGTAFPTKLQLYPMKAQKFAFHLRGRFFFFLVNPFSEGTCCTRKQRGNQILSCRLFTKWVKIYQVYTVLLNFSPTGDQEVTGLIPTRSCNILLWRLIMKYFL